MKWLFLFLSIFSYAQSTNFGIAIHGGAGTIEKSNITPELELVYRQKLEEAVNEGYKVLDSGGTATEAVIQAITILEDSPLFNAGKGAVFTHDETNELDASIMDGATLNAGAVAGVTNIENPIKLAFEVMQNSEHVMLSGSGAQVFAKERRMELVEADYFYTPERYKALQRIKNLNKSELDHADSLSLNTSEWPDHKFGTVGAVALDKNGNLAAGTSTGGMTNKRWNRIGDSPIVGAGTYANNNTCAVSSTGWGEYFIRGVVAYDVSAQMEYTQKALDKATSDVIQNKLTQLGGTGGIIAIDQSGNISFEFNTTGMYRAKRSARDDQAWVGIFKKE